MTASLAERIVNRIAVHADRPRASRRGFLGGATLVGAALVMSPWRYLSRPASAYDAVCGAHNTCAEGYTVFCCTINGGNNSCPPDSFIGGWWKADNSSFCGGNARYYIDCNAYRDGRYTCHCNTTTCDQRRVACNQFRYGQCNTQIPWSQTGPVLCRLVSCTPPWVQYGGTCSSSSATDNNTATHAAPCLTGKVPVGVVEEISASGNTVHIKGWAYDPDSPSTSISVNIYQDGKPRMGIHASLSRPDVNSSRHITGNHGFEVRFTASSGQHNFAVYAMNIKGGSGNPRIGSKTLTLSSGTSPIGHLDSATSSAGTVTLSGWAFDRDASSTSIAVNIYQDGKPLMGIRTGVPRSDVNSAYHISGTHGFKAQIKASVGTHNYKLYAMNVGGGAGNTLIGNVNVVVRSAVAPAGATSVPAGIRTAELTGNPAGTAVGELESVTASGNSVRLVGWLPDSGQSGELAVAVHEDDQVLHWYPVPGSARSAGTGRRGFDITVPAGTGLHTYSVHALPPPGADLGADADAADLPLIGQRTVRVNQSGAVGVLEQVYRLGDTVRLTGWVSDPDRPARRPALTVFRDGVALSRHSAGSAAGSGRPDPDDARDGFDISIADLPGVHTYTVYADSAEPGTPATLIGGRTLAEDGAEDEQVVPV